MAAFLCTLPVGLYRASPRAAAAAAAAKATSLSYYREAKQTARHREQKSTYNFGGERKLEYQRSAAAPRIDKKAEQRSEGQI